MAKELTETAARIFTIDDLRKAFNDGSQVTDWSDMGYTTKYDSFDDWYKEKTKEMAKSSEKINRNITENSRDALIVALETHLDTRDKRFMFLKVCFKELVSQINLEGSAHEVAWNIYSAFEKHQMLGSLMACMNGHLDCDLYLETT